MSCLPVRRGALRVEVDAPTTEVLGGDRNHAHSPDERSDRVELGNFGDHKGVGKGVFELRIDFGPGYRAYYGLDSEKLVILLAGETRKWQAYRQEKQKCP